MVVALPIALAKAGKLDWRGGGTAGREDQHLVNYGCVKEGTSLRRMKSSCGWLRKGLEEKDGSIDR